MIKFSSKELYDYLKKQKLFSPRGTRNLIYKYDDNTLIKINKKLNGYVMGYNEFLKCIEEVKRKRNLEMLEDTMKKILNLRTKIKETTLPLDMVYLDDLYVGTLVKFFDGYKDIDKCHFKSLEEIVNLSYTIINKKQELINNGIYDLDLTGGNILVNRDDVQIVDLDGEPCICKEKFDEELCHASYDSYFFTLKSLISHTCMVSDLPYININKSGYSLNYDEFKSMLDNYGAKLLKRKLTK